MFLNELRGPWHPDRGASGVRRNMDNLPRRNRGLADHDPRSAQALLTMGTNRASLDLRIFTLATARFPRRRASNTMSRHANTIDT
jgi:hypothetical protein